MNLLNSKNSNISCSFDISWNQSTINSQQPKRIVCIIACIMHGIFWLQLVFCSSVRQRSMQWIYAYLITDIFLLFRYFFVYIVHATSTHCASNIVWFLFICYFEAAVDNYLNLLEVYILLALNICRYIQIVYNRNVYQVHVKLLILAHFGIYVIPFLILSVQFIIGWAQLQKLYDELCSVTYVTIYIQIFNIIIAFILPIFLHITIICLSVRHVHLISTLQQGQHHVSAREKYNRSLVIQFLVFYIIWLILWSPNMIAYQLSIGGNVTCIVRLLNFIEILLDPIIIAALDFYGKHCFIFEQYANHMKEKFTAL
ncbi:unnamed protein product [Adineta steineri]|uniref:G-protein coupled receptors family 1 profile domain-containing protein n=1 Tax=Adineta steineri TaxID=433720 RepID=A0A820DPE3_9BILA|nr:unnamed protein product [Adineta steineri]CAF4235220.1 unnamed protein product [Adineta steineri]